LAVSSLVGLHAMFEAIAPSRRVVLSGDGGDELFAGYDWHVGMPSYPAWSASSAFRAAAPLLARFASASGPLGSVGTVARHIRRHPAVLYLDKLRITGPGELAALGLPHAPEDVLEASAVDAWERFAPAGLLEQMLAVDRATSLVDEMLAKMDTASMAYSVEVRVPFLAEGVVAAAKGLPARSKRSGRVGKVALRDWYADIGPPGLSSRRKTGFNSPLAAWLAGPAAEALRAWADAGRELLALRRDAASPRLTFALAVVGAWHARLSRAAQPVAS
jgi:asparagine synthase (glutamine-hydrolysing)